MSAETDNLYNSKVGLTAVVKQLTRTAVAAKAEGSYLHGPSPGQAGLQNQILAVVLHPGQSDGPPPTRNVTVMIYLML